AGTGDAVRRPAGDVVRAEPHASARWHQPHDRAHGRGLADAVPAEHGGHLGRRNRQIDAVQDVAGAVEGVHGFEAQHYSNPPRYALCTSPFALTASGAPSAMTRPRCSTVILSARRNTTSMSCSTRITVRPPARSMSRRMPIVWSVSSTERPWVG